MQTKQLLDKGNIVGRGNAYADGSALVNGNIKASVIPMEQLSFLEYQERLEKCATALGRTMDEMLNPLNSLALDIRKETGMGRYLESISNVSNVNNTRNSQVINQEIHVTLPNVTNSTSADELLRDLQSISYKKYQAFI